LILQESVIIVNEVINSNINSSLKQRDKARFSFPTMLKKNRYIRLLFQLMMTIQVFF